ncbi:glycosyl hydrolase 30 family protein [Abortiporus biennis]
MLLFATVSIFAVFTWSIAAQQIYDIWSTTWDRYKLFTYTNLSPNPINFPTYGFGGSLTDSSAKLLNNLKSSNSGQYNSLLKTLFDPTDGADAAGLSYLRVPLGASDFSDNAYTFDDTSVINDIRAINPYLKVHVLPWSPPGWMKDSGNIDGGNFLDQYISTFASYLLKAVQGFQSHGIPIYAIGIQNEPQNSNPTYPTCQISASQEAQIGLALRTFLSRLADAASFDDQDTFHNAFPNKEIYFTECSGSMGSDWWSDIKWDMDNLYIGSILHNARAALEWNLVLDGNGQPELPGSNSCGSPPCRGVVTLSGTSWTLNQEFYSMAQASKAVLPRDQNGPFGTRIGVSVGGSMSWGLVVNAFVTGRVNPSDWLRYSIVVLNWADTTNGAWDPQPIQTTIEFRGMQATYTFPVGVTTLWWYAPSTSSIGARTDSVSVNGTTVIPTNAPLNASVKRTSSEPSRKFFLL